MHQKCTKKCPTGGGNGFFCCCGEIPIFQSSFSQNTEAFLLEFQQLLYKHAPTAEYFWKLCGAFPLLGRALSLPCLSLYLSLSIVSLLFLCLLHLSLYLIPPLSLRYIYISKMPLLSLSLSAYVSFFPLLHVSAICSQNLGTPLGIFDNIGNTSHCNNVIVLGTMLAS